MDVQQSRNKIVTFPRLGGKVPLHGVSLCSSIFPLSFVFGLISIIMIWTYFPESGAICSKRERGIIKRGRHRKERKTKTVVEKKKVLVNFQFIGQDSILFPTIHI